MKYEKGKFLRRRNDGQVSGIHTDVGQKLLKNGSSIKARLLWSVTNLPPFYERVWAMAATIVKRELCTSSQWPKSFSMNDTQIQWEFRHKMLKDRWRKSKSSKTCLPPTPTSQINQRRKNDVHTEGSFIMATQKCNNFTKISNKKNLYINLKTDS